MKVEKVERKEMVDFIQKAITGLSEENEGTYLLTRSIVQEIIDQTKYESIVLKNAKVIVWNGKGQGVKVPYSNSPMTNEPATGIRAYWVDEAADKTNSVPTLGVSNIDFGKLVVIVPVTDELKNDVSALYDYIKAEAAKTIAYKLDREAMIGNGAYIKGVAGSGAKATLGAATSGDVTEAELKSFVDLLHPQAYANAAWYIAPQQYSVVTSLNYTSDSSLMFENGTYYLFGFPVVVAPQLTAEPYQIILGDFTRYTFVQREMSIKESEHIRFYNDESVLRIVLRIGGEVTAETGVLDDGNTYGWYIVDEAAPAAESSSSSSSSSESSQSTQSSDSSDSSSSSSSENYSQSSQSSDSSESSGGYSESSDSSSSSSSPQSDN